MLFLGTPDIAVPTLARVHASHEVAGVVCQPDKPVGRRGTPQPPPVKLWALEHGLEVHQPVRLNDGAFAAWIAERRPEAGVLAAYGRILKKPILDAFPQGVLNMHPSLLPRHRGPSPIAGALLEGDQETGVTIMRLSEEMDAGDILLQEAAPIDPEENAGTLGARLAEMGGHLTEAALAELEAGTAVFTPQDHAKATYTRLLHKEDGRMQWSLPARALHNMVRAYTPWPGAQTLWNGQVLRVLRTRMDDEEAAAPPGEVVQVTKSSLRVAAGQGHLYIESVQPPGKRPMEIAAFLQGRLIEAGDRFGAFA